MIAMLMRRMYGAGQHGCQFGRLAGGQRLSGKARRKALPLDILHDEKGMLALLADLVDLNDVRVLQERHGLGLPQEPPPLLFPDRTVRQDGLDGHDSPQGDLPGLEHDAHAATAQFLQDLVLRDNRPGILPGRESSVAWHVQVRLLGESIRRRAPAIQNRDPSSPAPEDAPAIRR